MAVLLLAAQAGASPNATPTVKLDLVGLFAHAAWPIRLTIGLLLFCSLLVWIIAVVKFLQLARLRSQERDFQRRAHRVELLGDLFDVARAHASPGARVVGQLFVRGAGAGLDRLRAIADRTILVEAQSARGLMWLLAFVAAGAPFIGLFGTVYGIMDAFIRIGAAKTASLPVVAPAIGEALITTAIGLAAAIPAVFFFNLIDKIIGDHVAELEASAAEYAALLAEQPPVATGVPAVQSAMARPGAFRARP